MPQAFFPCKAAWTRRPPVPFPCVRGGEEPVLGLSGAGEWRATPSACLGAGFGHCLRAVVRGGCCSPWVQSHSPWTGAGGPRCWFWGSDVPAVRQGVAVQTLDALVPPGLGRGPSLLSGHVPDGLRHECNARELAPRSGTVSSVGVTCIFHDISVFFVGEGGVGGVFLISSQDLFSTNSCYRSKACLMGLTCIY